MAAEPLSLVSVILFIAVGTLIFFLLFLFAKRQISRFTLKSVRRPHVAIGTDAPKVLRREIMRRMELVSQIKHEPILMQDKFEPTQEGSNAINHYYYRMKAVDAFSTIQKCIQQQNPGASTRHPSQTVRQYLIGLHSGPLRCATSDLINSVACAYEHARHDPEEFAEVEYLAYMELLDQLVNCIKEFATCQDEVVSGKVGTEVIFNDTKKNIPMAIKTQLQEKSLKNNLFNHELSESRYTRHRTSRPSSEITEESTASSTGQTVSYRNSAERLLNKGGKDKDESQV